MHSEKYLSAIIRGISSKKSRNIFIEVIKKEFAQVPRKRIGFIFDSCSGLSESEIIIKLKDLSAELDVMYSMEFIDKLKSYKYIRGDEIKDLMKGYTRLDVIMDCDDLIDIGFFIDSLTK